MQQKAQHACKSLLVRVQALMVAAAWHSLVAGLQRLQGDGANTACRKATQGQRGVHTSQGACDMIRTLAG